jgi:membrane-bound lytic murein transglycosylase B
MKRPLKPKVMGDIVAHQKNGDAWSAFRALPERLNLSEKKVIRIPMGRTLRYLTIAGAAFFLIFGSANRLGLLSKASGDVSSSTASSTDPSVERTALEAQLQTLETQIDQYQGQVTSYQSQGKTLNGEISILNNKIAGLNLQIQATNLTIEQLNDEITSTQSQIVVTQADIASKQASIQSLMNSIYKNDQTSLIEVFLENPRLSDFWDDTQNITLLQDNLRVAVQQVTDLQGQLQSQVQAAQASEADAANAAEYQQAQAAQIASTKTQKAQLLQATQGQESKYQALLVQTQASAAQIRNRIFQLLGGGQLSFEDAYQYAQVASNATGIDPSFILAILDRESALGQNVGQCNYKTAMSPSNQPLFLAIVQSLNIDPNSVEVSCPNADGVYGGAMGPAQFEPSTWDLYSSAVASITGDSPASPWNNADAFVATALYLKGGMTGCEAVYTALVSQERCTAAKYYAGSDWQNYLWTYGEAVVDRAQSFAADIQTITTS